MKHLTGIKDWTAEDLERALAMPPRRPRKENSHETAPPILLQPYW